VRVDGLVKNISDDFVLIKTNKHNIDAVIDKIVVSIRDIRDQVALDNLKSRLTDSLQQALNLSEGLVIVSEIEDKGFDLPELPQKLTDSLFSEKFSCPVDNIEMPEIEPRTFSFNSPYGACPGCSGLGKFSKLIRN